jgi:hypothetical protein
MAHDKLAGVEVRDQLPDPIRLAPPLTPVALASARGGFVATGARTIGKGGGVVQ